MPAPDALNTAQFRNNRYKVTPSPSGAPTYVANMPVEALLPHTIDRTSHPSDLRNVEALADSMRARGYSTRAHGGMDWFGTRGYADQAQPVHLVHSETGEIDMHNGNHRVHAAARAGLTHLPVLVTDYRR